MLLDLVFNSNHLTLQVFSASLVQGSIAIETGDIIGGVTGFLQLSLTLNRIRLGLDRIVRMQSLRLGHNDLGFSLRRSGQDCRSLKLSILDELNPASGRHIQVTDDASTLHIGGRILSGLRKELKNMTTLNGVCAFSKNCGYIPKHGAAIGRSAKGRSKFSGTIGCRQNTRHTNAHTYSSTESVRVVKGSKNASSKSGYEPILPDYTASVTKRVLKTVTVHTAKLSCIIDQHIGFSKNCVIGSTKRLTR